MRPSSLVHPPTPANEAPPQAGEIMQQIAEAEQLRGIGRSPSSLPTQWLAQMAVEARPSMLGKEEVPTGHGGKAPQKEFLQAEK